MTDERRTQIEEIAKEYGFSFASAKKFFKNPPNRADVNNFRKLLFMPKTLDL